MARTQPASRKSEEPKPDESAQKNQDGMYPGGTIELKSAPLPPVDTEPLDPNVPLEHLVPEKGNLRFAIFRARLFLEHLEKEFQDMLNDKEFVVKLRQAAVEEKCTLPGNARDWRVFKQIWGVLDRVPLPPV